MFHLKAMPSQFLLFPPLFILTLSNLLHNQAMHFRCWCKPIRWWDIVILVQILYRKLTLDKLGICRKTDTRQQRLEKKTEQPTISPSNKTFSPRTRNGPRGISAYRSLTKIRSIVSCRTKFAGEKPIDQSRLFLHYEKLACLPLPNWSQLRSTPIIFLPSRKTRTSFSATFPR